MCIIYNALLHHCPQVPLLLKLNLFSWTESRVRGEERWLTDMVRCNLGDLLFPWIAPGPAGDEISSKLWDLPWFLWGTKSTFSKFKCVKGFNLIKNIKCTLLIKRCPSLNGEKTPINLCPQINAHNTKQTWDSYCQAINSLYSSVYFLFFFLHRLEVILGLTNKTISCVLSEVRVSITGWMNVSTSACICACTVCTYTRVRCYDISDVSTLSFPRSH